MNEKKIFEDQDAKIQKLTTSTKKSDSIVNRLETKLLDENYFTLLGNDNAMTYFEKKGVEAIDVQNKVSNAILDKNAAPEGNSLVPYNGINGEMRINKIKFLNHRWVIADFTDGDYWGEMIFEYFINEDSSVDLTTLGSVLYTK
ncbi:hypothetical protein ACFQO1_04930 [Jejudonia soesokkakensis]|uniref:Hydrolase n=1 Tax=Jejudonia soesokkakensis TaxID=1323432 RepID=A0ABW2MT14_9FLAO